MTFFLVVGLIGFVVIFEMWLVETVWAAGDAHGYERGRRDERRFGR